MLAINYTLSEARTILNFARKCHLKDVRDMFLKGGLNQTPPPEMVTIEIPRVATETSSWYGGYPFEGNKMANGKLFSSKNQHAMAHQYLPIGMSAVVVYEATGKWIEEVVTDRGPCVQGREVDLTEAAAKKIGIKPVGVGHITRIIRPR